MVENLFFVPSLYIALNVFRYFKIKNVSFLWKFSRPLVPPLQFQSVWVTLCDMCHSCHIITLSDRRLPINPLNKCCWLKATRPLNHVAVNIITLIITIIELPGRRNTRGRLPDVQVYSNGRCVSIHRRPSGSSRAVVGGRQVLSITADDGVTAVVVLVFKSRSAERSATLHSDNWRLTLVYKNLRCALFSFTIVMRRQHCRHLHGFRCNGLLV